MEHLPGLGIGRLGSKGEVVKKLVPPNYETSARPSSSVAHRAIAEEAPEDILPTLCDFESLLRRLSDIPSSSSRASVPPLGPVLAILYCGGETTRQNYRPILCSLCSPTHWFSRLCLNAPGAALKIPRGGACRGAPGGVAPSSVGASLHTFGTFQPASR